MVDDTSNYLTHTRYTRFGPVVRANRIKEGKKKKKNSSEGKSSLAPVTSIVAVAVLSFSLSVVQRWDLGKLGINGSLMMMKFRRVELKNRIGCDVAWL